MLKYCFSGSIGVRGYLTAPQKEEETSHRDTEEDGTEQACKFQGFYICMKHAMNQIIIHEVCIN